MSTSLLNTWRSVNCQRKEDALTIAQTSKQKNPLHHYLEYLQVQPFDQTDNINLRKSENRKKGWNKERRTE